MKWKTLLQLLYIGLLAFGFWIAHAKAEVQVVVASSVVTTTSSSTSTLPETVLFDPDVIRSPASDQACPEIQETAHRAQAHQMRLRNGVCILTLSVKEKDYPRRSLIWNSEGKFMSFVALEHGQGTSAYYIMPTESFVKLDGRQAHSPDYEVKTSSEMIWSLDKANGEFRLPSECTGTVTSVAEAQKGGVVLKTCKDRLLIDMGWSTKESPEMKGKGQATIRDPQGHSCRVPFTAFLNYKVKGEEVSPKFSSSRDWHKFLKNYRGCEGLNLSFLIETNQISQIQKPKFAQ